MLSIQVNQIGKIISLYYYEAKATSFYFSVLQKEKKKSKPLPLKKNQQTLKIHDDKQAESMACSPRIFYALELRCI